MIIRRRTKIVATIGPSLDDEKELDKVIQAGVNVFRSNFSHGSYKDHKRYVDLIRKLAKKAGREVAIFADLQGPKIRISRFKNGKVILKEGAEFTLDAEMAENAGTQKAVGIHYKGLAKDVSAGDVLLLNDGLIVLCVQEVIGAKIICRIVIGGELSDHKGINRQGGGLSAKALTDKDHEDIKFAATLDMDFFAVSFVRSASDVKEARELIQTTGSKAGVISKIERVEAVKNIAEIIKASDAIMVARGDLGVEIGDAELPAVQKRLIRLTCDLNKPVITATQMMESMLTNMIPTRAEVFDVANAVLDNTDAVMLSEETAIGKHPHVVVEAMSRICLGSEKQPETQHSEHRMTSRFQAADESIAMAAMYIANHEDIKAIIALTESGSTPLWMSRIRSGIPIFGLTRNIATERRMNLYQGVYPIHFDVTKVPPTEIDKYAVETLKKNSALEKGDLVLITRGEISGVQGKTNTMKIYEV